MAIPRASAAPAALGRTLFRRAATQTRNQAWRQIGRRQYASEHGGQKSSELPWIIGSVGFTVPAAVWLFGQGPKGTTHTPEVADEQGDEEATEKEDSEEEAQEAQSKEATSSKDSAHGAEDEKEGGEDKDDSSSDSDSSKDESSDEKSEDSGDDSKQESKDEGKDEGKDSDSKGSDGKPERKYSDDGYELPGPNAPGQINYKSGSGKGPGEGQKGERSATERKGDKDSYHDSSGAQNPYLDQNKEEKSKKGQGITDTAKIHGTVDTSRPSRGPQANPGKID